MELTQASSSQAEKAKRFFELHHQRKLLVLPNIWDSLGAQLLQDLNYPAVATASAAIAFSNGHDDGEKIPFDHLLSLLRQIVKSVTVPVSADVESGFAENDSQLGENIKLLVQTGIVGINIEDVDKETDSLLPIDIACNRIRLIKKISGGMGVPLFINARTDVYLRGKNLDTPALKLEETLKRGAAYKHSGADCFYPIGMTDQADIAKTIEVLQMPINVLTIPGIPELDVLDKMGVARVSLGPSFLKIAIRSMKNLAVKLQHYEGLSEITGNEITSAYLKKLVGAKP